MDDDRDDTPRAAEPADDGSTDEAAAAVSDPAEVIRLATMLQALMVEVRDLELDDSGRSRLFEIQRSAVEELSGLLSEDLESELRDLGLPIEDSDASGIELRLAQSQLVGWLNGLFQGIQASFMAQQQGAARQLQQLRQQRPELTESYSGGQYL